jgi:hypothetical protein
LAGKLVRALAASLQRVVACTQKSHERLANGRS